MLGRTVYKDGDRWVVDVSVTNQRQYEAGPFRFDGTMDSVMKSLAAIRLGIPEPFRSSARCEIGTTGANEGTPYARITIAYRRPATAAEIEVAEAEEAASRATAVSAVDYEALKRKYEEQPWLEE